MSYAGLRCLERVADMICFKSLHLDFNCHLSARRGDGDSLDSLINDTELNVLYGNMSSNINYTESALEEKINAIVAESTGKCTDIMICQYLYDSIPIGNSEIEVPVVQIFLESYCIERRLPLKDGNGNLIK